MPIKQQILFQEGIFFITITCHKWIHLFEITTGYDIVYKWFDFLRLQNHYIVAFTIMPNHLHVIIGFTNKGIPINKIIGGGKRFMAYEIINRLKSNNQMDILELLARHVKKSDQKRGKLYEVWEDSFDWKDCRSAAFILQKLEYLHRNPCAGKWKLAPVPEDYLHSSARYYCTGEQGIYPVTHYQELL